MPWHADKYSIFALVISTVALLVSGAATYFSYLQAASAAKANVIASTHNRPSVHLEIVFPDTILKESASELGLTVRNVGGSPSNYSVKLSSSGAEFLVSKEMGFVDAPKVSGIVKKETDEVRKVAVQLSRKLLPTTFVIDSAIEYKLDNAFVPSSQAPSRACYRTAQDGTVAVKVACGSA